MRSGLRVTPSCTQLFFNGLAAAVRATTPEGVADNPREWLGLLERASEPSGAPTLPNRRGRPKAGGEHCSQSRSSEARDGTSCAAKQRRGLRRTREALAKSGSSPALRS